MSAGRFVSFQSHWSLSIGLALLALAAGVTYFRRPELPRVTLAACGAGALLLALAAGAMQFNREVIESVAVMVDLSPSTRTAEFRDPAALDRRIHELLRDVPYRITYFAQQTTDIAPPGRPMGDLPADHTVLSPPAAPAILLFSDCQFAIPARAPPTYIVIDSGLEDVDDAAVSKLEIRGTDAAVTVRNSGTARQLAVNGITERAPTTLPAGSVVLTRSLASGVARVSAELAPGDAWPENDALSIDIAPPEKFERWWVSRSSVPDGYRGMSPSQLPTDPAEYLAPGIIVLENLPASDLSEIQQQRLRQYVRDIGGAVLILGGNRAFAAGGYEGSTLDTLSPMASDPPAPTTHWILLADASGSMSASQAGSTRFPLATEAIARLLPHLPPHDLVSVGSFAQALDWWTQSAPVSETQSRALPPANVFPHGPTNLQQALEAIAGAGDGQLPSQLLVLSDFDAHFTNAAPLQSRLRAKHMRLHLLAIGKGSALPLLRRLSAATGGTSITQLDPGQWAQSVRELAQAASSDHLQHDPVEVNFRQDAAGAPRQTTPTWNRLWLKSGATVLADATLQTQTVPMAARWHDGEGQAAAAAFDPAPAQVAVLGKLIERAPRDPRFHVTCDAGERLVITVDAVDGDKPLNDEPLSLELKDLSTPAAPAVSKAVPQTGPGLYEIYAPAPRSPALATLRDRGKIIAQSAIAGRYAAEFENLGNNHDLMARLARQSGGQVIAPDQTSPINVHWPLRPVPLTSPLAIAGAALIALGLAWSRLH
jgi:hypothetical protein